MTKIKRGRKSVWPKNSRKVLNLGLIPKEIHKEIRAFAKLKQAEILLTIKIENDANNG